MLLSHKSPKCTINVKVEFGEGEGKVSIGAIAKRAEAYKPKEKVTYKKIIEHIKGKYRFKVRSEDIKAVKRELGIASKDELSLVEEVDEGKKLPKQEKVEAIKDALKYFEVI